MLEDGIYIVKRGRDMTLGPEKTMRVSAYNNREGDGSVPDESTFFQGRLLNYTWKNYTPYYKYIIGDGNSYLANYIYYQMKSLGYYVPVPQTLDGYAIFEFDSPGAMSTITNVSIQVYGAGKIKTIIRDPNTTTQYYGATSTARFVYDWIQTDYATRPWGGAWTFSDIGQIQAGAFFWKNTGGLVSKIRIVVTHDSGQTTTIYPNRDLVDANVNRTDGNPFTNKFSAVFDDFYYKASNFYYQNGSSIRYASNFSQIPPAFSQINSITLHWAYCAGLVQNRSLYNVSQSDTIIPFTTSDTIVPYIYLNGTRYYGPSAKLVDGMIVGSWSPITGVMHDDIMTSDEYTISSNPGTGASFNLSELQGAFFGLEVPSGSGGWWMDGSVVVSNHRDVNIYLDYADIKYQEIAGETVEYIKLPAEIQCFTKRVQNPISPDELNFTMPSGNFLPECTEITLVNHGEHVFHGIVWNIYEDPGRGLHVTAKSQQVLLDFRHFSSYSCRPRNGTLDKLFSLHDLFSDDTPTRPYNQYVAGIENHESVCSPSIGSRWATDVILTQQSSVGLFFIINSYIPTDIDLNGRISGIAKSVINRPLFSISSDPSITEFNWNYSGDTSYGILHPPNTHAWDYVGGLHRLCWRAAPPCIAAEFALSGEDLYVAPYAGSRHVLCDHLFDTFIRPGTNEYDDLILNIAYTFNGPCGTAFDDFFSRIGEEIQFLPSADGYVYLNAASEISRGSEASPVRKYENSNFCSVTKTLPSNPFVDAVVGAGDVPLVSSDWIKPRGSWLSQVISDGTRSGEDFQEYLDLTRSDDTTTYNITVQEEDYLLRPGDWIWVKSHNEGYAPARVKQIGITPGYTRILAGHSVVNISSQWGMWRNAIGSSDTDTKIQSQEIVFDDTTGTETFTVLANNAIDPDWKCWIKADVDFIIAPEIVDGINTTTVEANGSPAAIMTAHGGTVDADYDVMIIGNAGTLGNYYWDTYPKWKWRKDGGTWSTIRELQSKEYALSDGVHVVFRVSYGTMDSNDVIAYINPIASSLWHIETVAPQSPLKEVLFSDKNMFFIVTLNGKVVPPGRIKCYEDNPGFEIEITDLVNKSTSSDTINTVTVTLRNGLTKAVSPKWYQTITGSVDQYKRVKVLENA
jgi:hypothetical protein